MTDEAIRFWPTRNDGFLLCAIAALVWTAMTHNDKIESVRIVLEKQIFML